MRTFFRAAHDSFSQPGTWSRGKSVIVTKTSAVGQTEGGGTMNTTRVLTALIVCPVCFRSFSLSKHGIGDDGTVTPSVVCPFAGCSFHDQVRLQGWDANETA